MLTAEEGVAAVEVMSTVVASAAVAMAAVAVVTESCCSSRVTVEAEGVVAGCSV